MQANNTAWLVWIPPCYLYNGAWHTDKTFWLWSACCGPTSLSGHYIGLLSYFHVATDSLKKVNISSGNCVSPIRYQTITQLNINSSAIWPSETFNKIWSCSNFYSGNAFNVIGNMSSIKRYGTTKIVPIMDARTTSSIIKERTPSNGNIFRVTGPLCGEFTGPGEFPTQRPVTRSFDVFFDLRPNERLSKQPWGWWFETLSCSLWRHCNVDTYQVGSIVD